jgi:8-oxo-dGTP pyrophosphatase MutT (NUDIX family)
VEADESGFDAALRETEEEVGVPRAALRPLGAAPPVYAAVTNFAVATFVTYLPDPPASFTWDPGELVGVVSVALEELLDPDAWQLQGPHHGRQLPTQDVVIWGLTERILAGVLPFLREARNATRSATH